LPQRQVLGVSARLLPAGFIRHITVRRCYCCGASK
jgi:hypothetical protein